VDAEGLETALDGLLAGRAGSAGGLAVDAVEALLTRGYAEALEIDVKRLLVVERVDALLSDSAAPRVPNEIAELRLELVELGNRRRRLRERLAEVAMRVGVTRPFTAHPG
jgi:hypothetical protein